MRFDIAEGNFCEALLGKISSDDKTGDSSSQSSSDSPAPGTVQFLVYSY